MGFGAMIRYFSGGRKGSMFGAAAVLLLAGGVLVTAATADAATLVSCPVRATKVGTNGPDKITGTPGNDVICAGGGDDEINGGGGNDTVYAGSGDDQITTGTGGDYLYAGSGSDVVDARSGTDLIYGDNPVGKAVSDVSDVGPDGNDLIHGGEGSDPIDGGGGNDIILTGGDGGSRPSSSFTHGGPGNDIILSDIRYPALNEFFFGDEGSDLLVPNPIRISPLGNVAIGGGGNDVVILMNGLPDSATMGDLAGSVSAPLGKFCSVSIPLPAPLNAGDTGKLSCKLPLGVKVPGVIDDFVLNATVDAKGHAGADVTLKPSPELSQVQGLINVARGNYPSDICLCDPKGLPGWAGMLADRVH